VEINVSTAAHSMARRNMRICKARLSYRAVGSGLEGEYSVVVVFWPTAAGGVSERGIRYVVIVSLLLFSFLRVNHRADRMA
jgi:hypothetical protein